MRTMNINDYEKNGFEIYKAFAKTVQYILEQAIQFDENLRIQSVQCRAKEPRSLRRRLVEAGKMDTQKLEIDRRDLAGVRVIFYTNNDVKYFLNSHLIHKNFDIEEDSTKIHYATPEKKMRDTVQFITRLDFVKNEHAFPNI